MNNISEVVLGPLFNQVGLRGVQSRCLIFDQRTVSQAGELVPEGHQKALVSNPVGLI